jgi:hypothetical protein
MSVRDDVTLRDDATIEGIDDRLKADSWSNCTRSFISWYNDYRFAHLNFVSPEGEIVRQPMPNSHQPRYGDKYYAKIKALERQMLKQYENPTVVMLTLTASTKNANDGWRCPADHLRDVVNTWRPDDGRGVYHHLRYHLEDYEWEYALVTEHHKNGYGHIHVAVFVDGDISEDRFRPAIDAHLRECNPAGPDAHDYFHPDDEKRPISVRSIDPNAFEGGKAHGDCHAEDVQNLGSYIGEYIGAHGSDLLDRSLEEIQFRAVCWATGTQRVRFSVGANEMIAEDLDASEASDEAIDEAIVGGWREDVTEEDIEETPAEELGELLKDGAHSWGLQGIGRVDREGESIYDAAKGGVSWVTLDQSSPHLDPEKTIRFSRPTPKRVDKEISDYQRGGQ